jgi:hypothetical protein
VSSADVNYVLLALTAVLVVLTAVVTWFARQTVRESRKATTAIKETVTESTRAAEASQQTVAMMRDLLTVARDTAVSSAKSVAAAEQSVAASEQLLAAARETIDVAAAARAADEHDRKVRQLRDIGQIAETIFWKAVRDAQVKPPQLGWRLIEHNYLEQALVSMADDLPECMALTQVNLPDTAVGAARDARNEVVRALQKLNAERS